MTRLLRITAAAILLMACVAGTARAAVSIEWDPASRRYLGPGGYARLIRLDAKTLLLSYETGGQPVVRRSTDDGTTWGGVIRVTDYRFGAAANPEMVRLADGRVLLFFNHRPRDKKHAFAINMAVSRDGGRTWSVRAKPVYEADTVAANGCWEPAALQLPGGEIQLFFANENPFRESDEQEITLMRSRDGGRSWGEPETVAFRAGHRDGMPVPLLLADGRGIAFSIEDNGLAPGNRLQPAIVWTSLTENWKGPIAATNGPRRWGAVTPPLAGDVYAGAPFLRQLPTGETLLACQSTEGDRAERMVVYVGDASAKNFASRSVPFELPSDVKGEWNSLFVKNTETVIALSSTNIDGRRGVWMIDGKVRREKAD